MLEHTKKPLTEAQTVALTFRGPKTTAAEAIRCLHTLGFAPDESSLPCREFSPWSEEELPSVCLLGARTKEGLTQQQLAGLSGIPRRHISEMENNHRGIGLENARKLARVLKVHPLLLVRSQKKVDPCLGCHYEKDTITSPDQRCCHCNDGSARVPA